MNETIEGTGRLQSQRGQEWRVEYRFDITTRMVGAGVRLSSSGRVNAVDGSAIPVGEYHLYPDSGDEVMIRVKNLDFEWAILAPIA